jgi:hypothetical protein
MEIFIEEPDVEEEPPISAHLISFDDPLVRKPKPVLPSMIVRASTEPYETDICDTMTWDSAISPSFVRAMWPHRNIKFVRAGRAFAPITEIPIAQIPYLTIVAKYFDQHTIQHSLQPFLNRKLLVALRDIDWLMVNYSKQYDSSYFLSRVRKGPLDSFTPGNELVSIYEMYNNTLHMYRRRHFRTYKQGHRMYLWTDKNFEETTVGQLLCLMWAIEWGVVSFAFYHCKHIKDHETFVSKTNQADIDSFKQRGMKRKRMELVTKPVSDLWVVEIPQESLSLGSLSI